MYKIEQAKALTSLVGHASNLTKIPSEMEVAPLLTVYTAYIASAVHTVYIV